MGAISTTDARALFTKAVVDVYKEMPQTTSFLRSLFPSKEYSTKELSIEVQRGTEKIAVDVERGTEGNRNSFSRSTEKVFVPPYYKEYFDATQIDLYDRLFGSEAIDSGVFAQFVQNIAENNMQLKEKIERSYELQCSQVLQTGIVTLNSGINIDFKRKAASLVNLGSINSNRYWNDQTNSTVFDDVTTACDFLRQVGKSQGGTINAIFGSKALTALLNNTKFKESADIRNYKLADITSPMRNATGATLHGSFSAGAYDVMIWSYPEFYDNSSNVSTPYIDPRVIIFLPESPRFRMGFAAVPQLLNQAPKRGAFLFRDYIDERSEAHIFEVKSAGLAIPVAVDQIYTLQVLA
jgi:hypothetical protein